MSDTHDDDLPAGHPAGTDDTLTAGEVLSGRGQGRAGAVSEAEELDSPQTKGPADGD